MLALHGFNYTDLTISHYSVDGVGGGNIFVSSPTAGGSGTSCCVPWVPGTALPQPVRVEWLRSVDGKDRWCSKTVQLQGPVPANPSDFAVHFMPDGGIQVEVTSDYPDLKLRLARYSPGRRKESGNVLPDEASADCTDHL